MVSDVVPAAVEPVAVDGLPRREPPEEAAGVVGALSILEEDANEAYVLGRQEVDQRRSERRRGIARLLDEPHNAARLVGLGDAVMGRELQVADVVERHGACGLRLGVRPLDETRQGELEEVVAGQDEQLVVLEPALLDHEPQVADRAEPVVVRGRSVVVHRHALRLRPAGEDGGEAVIRDEVDRIHLVDLTDTVEHPVEHRPAADRKQVLGHVVRQRSEPGRVARRKDQGLHAGDSPSCGRRTAAGGRRVRSRSPR